VFLSLKLLHSPILEKEKSYFKVENEENAYCYVHKKLTIFLYVLGKIWHCEQFHIHSYNRPYSPKHLPFKYFKALEAALILEAEAFPSSTYTIILAVSESSYF
jgi:hypothetical protein